MHLLEFIAKLDRELFLLINANFAFTSVDYIFLLLRKAEVWIPLYAAMLTWIAVKHPQYAIAFALATLISFALTDFVSATLLKPVFHRLRPCYNVAMQNVMRSLVACGGSFGFPSSHASNHFGLASFWFTAIRVLEKRNWYGIWLWALAICYAQVYVGKHYPLDIFGGAVLGILTGFFSFKVFQLLSFSNALYSIRTRTKEKQIIAPDLVEALIAKIFG